MVSQVYNPLKEGVPKVFASVSVNGGHANTSGVFCLGV
jgi:hypothetical protein